MSGRFDAALARRLRFVQEAALQPQGPFVAYTLRVRDDDPERETVELWWHDLRDGSDRRVEGGGASFASPVWSASGRLLAVGMLHEGRRSLAILAAGAAQAVAREALPGPVAGACAWDGDARLALVLARAQEEAVAPERPYRTTADVWERDGVGRVDLAGSDLWELSVSAGGDGAGALRRLTDTPTAKASPAWSPSSGRLLFEDRALERLAGTTVRVLDLVSGAVREAVPASYRPHSAAWAGEAAIVFAGIAAGAIAGTQEDLFVVEPGGAAPPVNRTAGLPGAVSGFLDGDLPAPAWWDPTPILVDPEGRTATVRVHAGGACEVRRIGLAGPERSELLLGGPRACTPCGLARDGRLLALVASFAAPPDLVLRDPDGAERRLTDLNGAVLAQAPLAPLRPLLKRTPDGGIDAWFAAPTGAGAGPWPTVAILHGGPHAASGELLHVGAQLLLAAGIGVLLVNHRGSKGYDDAFGVALHGRWAHATVADTLTAVEEAVARGWADPDRLGVHGQSAGGTLTCWLACLTSRFAAAAAENAATNFVSLVGSSDIGPQLLPDLLGAPDGGLQEWLAQSPVAAAHRCRTPLLLIQAEADRRCPPEQGEQLYRLLRLHGGTAEMLRIPGGTHDASVLGTPVMREAQEAALTAWFTRHLRRREIR